MSFLILVLLFYSKKETKISSRIQAIPVSMYNVNKPRDVEAKLEYPGRTRNISYVTIFARVTDILEKNVF